MTILALDIALRRSGWALVRSETDYETGAWETKGDAIARWRQIRAECQWLGSLYLPSVVAIEDAGPWGKSARNTSDRSIRALASARSVAACACSDFARVLMVSVDEWKEAFAGSARVDKVVVQSILKAEGYDLPLRGRSRLEDGDQCDALALGLTMLRKQRVLERRGGTG